MASTPVVTKHLAHLDGWRALAALWVVIDHCWLNVDLGKAGPLVGIFTIFSFGRVSVDMFIVLSGFCLMLPVLANGGVLRGGMIEFIKRRAWRILPPYYFALALTLLLIICFIHQDTGTPWDFELPLTAGNIVAHLFLVHDAFSFTYYGGINYVFWSIAVEWRIYFFFPLLVLGWRHLGPVKTVLLGLAASWVLARLCQRVIGETLTLNYLGLFVLGMFAAVIANPSTPSLTRWRNLPWGWITLGLLVIAVGLCNIQVRSPIRDYGIGFVSAALLVLTTIHREAWYHRLLGSPPLAFIGTFAYSIYLIHAPLLQMLYQYPFAPIQPHVYWMRGALILSIPAVVAVCYLFFLACERPFLRRRKPAPVATAPARAESVEVGQAGPSPG